MTLFNYLAYALGSFGTITLVLICYIVLKFVIIPLWKMSGYKKKGVPCYYYPFLGPAHRGRMHEQQYNDDMAYYRRLSQTNPDMRAEVVNFGSRLSLFIYDPKLIKEFYANQANYKKIPFEKTFTTLIGTGLVLAEGNLWKNHRKVISNVFHFEFIKDNIPLIVSTTHELLNDLAKTSLKSLSIMDEIQKITGEIVGRIFFGENLGRYTLGGLPLTLYLAQLLTRSSMMYKNPLTVLLIFTGMNIEWVAENRQYMNDIKDFRKLCIKIVEERKASKNKSRDMLGLLLETQNAANPEDRFSDEDIINEFVTFFVAGMDTTGHLVTMVLYLLDKNPQYREQIQREIYTIYNKSNPVTIEEINQMEMMHAVLKEGLRLYSPAPAIFPRLAQVDHKLLDIEVKKGMSVRPTFLFNFSSPKYFEEPEKFIPERWLNKQNNKREQSLEAFVDIPFSSGARNCIGQHLAMLESKIIIAEFMKMFSFKVVPEDYKLVMTFNFLYEPKQKILVDLERKQ